MDDAASVTRMVKTADPALAEVWRGDYLEAVHHGCLAVTNPDGSVALVLGDVDSPFLARSAIKPFQAIAMLRAGLDLTGAELALASASHSGEEIHVEGARDILVGAGLTEDALQVTPGTPLDPQAARAWFAAGHGEERIIHNCSGKHSAMVRTCVRAGWPLESYLEPGHPLQIAIRETLAQYTGDEIGDPVPDGCGAPALPCTVAGLARAFGRFAAGDTVESRSLADAYRAHPEYVSGTRRDELVLHREVSGLVCKMGAEGTLAVGLSDGTGIVVKASDGAHRATVPVVVAVLDALGLATDTLREFQPQPVLGHGRVVGRVSASQGLLVALAGM